MSEDSFPRCDPRGKQLRAQNRTQSATLRINRRSAYRNLSPSILHSKLIIFHSSPPRFPRPRLRLKTEH